MIKKVLDSVNRISITVVESVQENKKIVSKSILELLLLQKLSNITSCTIGEHNSILILLIGRSKMNYCNNTHRSNPQFSFQTCSFLFTWRQRWRKRLLERNSQTFSISLSFSKLFAEKVACITVRVSNLLQYEPHFISLHLRAASLARLLLRAYFGFQNIIKS